MKIFVISSNKYTFLLQPYATLFNRYWPDQDIIFLGYDKSLVGDLPSNCSFISMGEQSEDWSSPLIKVFSKLPEEYFLVTMEDMFLMDYVDGDHVRLLEDIVKAGNAQKSLLDTHLNDQASIYRAGAQDLRYVYPRDWLPHERIMLPSIMELSQDVPYRSTLHPAIWRKEYFMKCLRPGMTAWEFEVRNMSITGNDGERIIAPSSILFQSANVFSKGRPFPYMSSPHPYGAAGPVRQDDVDYILHHIKQNEVRT